MKKRMNCALFGLAAACLASTTLGACVASDSGDDDAGDPIDDGAEVGADEGVSPGDDGDPPPPEMVTLCDNDVSAAEFARYLDGNLVIVAAFSDEGSSKARAISELVIALVLNGIDFANLGSAKPSYSDGRYSLKTGASEVGFSLAFAEAFEDWSAGETIPHNIFDPASYARNIHINIDASQFPPVATLEYDPGPLAGLVKGSIRIDENTFAVKVELRTDLLDIQVDSGSPYENVWEAQDSLWLQMTTTSVNVLALAGDLEDAGFGFSYDETRYAAPQSDLEQEFYDSEFLTLRMDNGNYRWEGDYRSTVTKGGTTMYQAGFASNAGGNYTDYFCDQELLRKVGTAMHADSLRFGTFVFEDGASFPYGIQ